MEDAMRKIAIRALVVLVPVFASLPALGQEKPNVQVPKPTIERRALQVLQELQIDRQTAQLHRALSLALQGERVSSEDLVNKFMQYPRFKMPEGLELTVQELEAFARFAGGGNFVRALAALDAAERAAMKARRSWKESTERFAKDAGSAPNVRAVALSSDGRVALLSRANVDRRRRVFAEDADALQAARRSLRRAVASLRKARHPGEAGRALDELDESVTALRVLLWEQASKRD